MRLDEGDPDVTTIDMHYELGRIGLIVGECHGQERFHKLVQRRFGDWRLKILKHGELGTFWLQNLRY